MIGPHNYYWRFSNRQVRDITTTKYVSVDGVIVELWLWITHSLKVWPPFVRGDWKCGSGKCDGTKLQGLKMQEYTVWNVKQKLYRESL